MFLFLRRSSFRIKSWQELVFLLATAAVYIACIHFLPKIFVNTDKRTTEILSSVITLAVLVIVLII